MAYYDEYSKRQISGLGAWIKRREVEIFKGLLRVESRRGERWLEIGPGEGRFARSLSSSQIRWTGIELHPGFAERLRGESRSIVRGDGARLPFDGGRFDLVLSSHVLEHMAGPQAAHAFLAEQLRVLRSGGQLVVCAPDFLRLGTVFWDADFTHTYPTTAERIRQLLAGIGLEHLHTRLILGPFSGLSARLLDPFLVAMPWTFLRAFAGEGRAGRVVYKLRLSTIPTIMVSGTKP